MGNLLLGRVCRVALTLDWSSLLHCPKRTADPKFEFAGCFCLQSPRPFHLKRRLKIRPSHRREGGKLRLSHRLQVRGSSVEYPEGPPSHDTAGLVVQPGPVLGWREVTWRESWGLEQCCDSFALLLVSLRCFGRDARFSVEPATRKQEAVPCAQEPERSISSQAPQRQTCQGWCKMHCAVALHSSDETSPIPALSGRETQRRNYSSAMAVIV